MKIAALALCSLALVACGASDDAEPKVDWSQVPQNQHRLIDQAVSDGDCQKMQGYFDSSSTSDVLRYLDWHMKKAGCY